MSETTNDPVVELITQNLLAALAEVTAANGYYNTFSVIREATRPEALKDRQAFVSMGSVVRVFPDEGDSYGTVAWKQTFEIGVFVQVSEDFADSIDHGLDREKARAFSDVFRTVMVDVTRGGYAYDTNVLKADPREDGIVVTVDVTYRTRYNDVSALPTSS
jgi:hypothetical protein